MSILKSTHAGSKAIPVTSEQTILDEIAKLGYTYNYILKRWSNNINPLPDIIVGHTHDWSSFFIYVIIKKYTSPTYYNITTMYDLFNFIEDMKKKYVNS